MRPHPWTVFMLEALLIFSGAGGSWADDLLIRSLTLEEFADRGIKTGISGREAAMNFENAGYTREIAFRQTDSPTLSAGNSHQRSETKTGSYDSVVDTEKTTLTLNENTPLGSALSATGTYGDSNKPGLNASLSQPIFLFVWNPSLRTRKRADLSFANAKDTYDATVLSLWSQARSLYYSVMVSEEFIKVEQRKFDSTRKLLDITQALVDAGKSAPVDAMRAKLNLQVDQRSLENAITQREKAILSAKDFIFFPLDQPLHLITKLRFQPFQVSLERLTDYAMIHRPQLRTLRRAKELAHLDTQSAKEATRPTLAVNSTYGYNELYSAVTHSWSLGLNANWLFFDSFVTNDRVKNALISEEVADLNLTQTERSTRVSIQNTFWDIKRVEKQISEFQNSREQAQRNVDVLRLRFQNGVAQILDVFSAESDMRSLDNEYLNLLTQFNSLKDQLSQVVGANVETVR